ncbi:MAG TPA: TerB family tellurite resistance protein, partial [Chryseosolibacter sp.]
MNDLSRMKLLINLAKVDGQIADKEKNHLITIGRANGIYPDEIYPLFTQSHQVVVPADLSDDDKFDLIFNLIQLMKLDERMYREEIVFCGQVAAKLGYDRNVMFELL